MLFKKKEQDKFIELNGIYAKLKEYYNYISDDRKEYLREKILKYGYLPYSYRHALEELSWDEVLYGLQFKWEANKVFCGGEFNFKNNEISPLARKHVKNSDWIKKEGHDIKLINLAGLGNGNVTREPGKFMDWLRQLLILPTGNPDSWIFNTTIYLIPFHPREFGCAYLPKSSDVSENLLDENIQNLTGLDAKGQVKTFITLAQLAGHPVIYDILPQTGRFAKAVLSNPGIARWFDIKALEKTICDNAEIAAQRLLQTFDAEDVEVIKDIYIHGGEGDLSEHFQIIYDEFEKEMAEIKKHASNVMLVKKEQEKIHKRVKEIVKLRHCEEGIARRSNLIMLRLPRSLRSLAMTEDSITNQLETIHALINEGLWPAPGGAWCSAGVPVFDKMSQCGSYPLFKHYDYKGEDVSNFANLDCQTPYYFTYLENGKYNKPVIDYFINSMKALRKEYNFDGFRVDHIDHVVDKVSEKNGMPISYRAPRIVLNKLNKTMKSLPYFATLAEYMLWDDYLKEYHKDMHFDLLWGNDIVSQFEKTPEKIIEDNQHLANYNVNFKNGEKLSVLKAYNNQDGEFRAIDQYPGQLTEAGALYKWFKYKCLPGGKSAQRPVLYIDGDESFTKTGIESAIGEEISMPRENNYEFFTKFDAIDRFVKSQPIITEGEAQIFCQVENGFCAWIISKEPLKTGFLIVSNYKYPTEKVKIDEAWEIARGKPIHNQSIHMPSDYSVTGEYIFDGHDFVKTNVNNLVTLNFETLNPAEFKIYEIKR